jgi:hypothetical protein
VGDLVVFVSFLFSLVFFLAALSPRVRRLDGNKKDETCSPDFKYIKRETKRSFHDN